MRHKALNLLQRSGMYNHIASYVSDLLVRGLCMVLKVSAKSGNWCSPTYNHLYICVYVHTYIFIVSVLVVSCFVTFTIPL